MSCGQEFTLETFLSVASGYIITKQLICISFMRKTKQNAMIQPSHVYIARSQS